MASHKGPVVFIEGVHYPVKGDHADLKRPLRWDPETKAFRDAEKDEPLHNDVHHAQDLELEIGGES
jgi:hypothetical protein